MCALPRKRTRHQTGGEGRRYETGRRGGGGHEIVVGEGAAKEGAREKEETKKCDLFLGGPYCKILSEKGRRRALSTHIFQVDGVEKN